MRQLSKKCQRKKKHDDKQSPGKQTLFKRGCEKEGDIFGLVAYGNYMKRNNKHGGER